MIVPVLGSLEEHNSASPSLPSLRTTTFLGSSNKSTVVLLRLQRSLGPPIPTGKTSYACLPSRYPAPVPSPVGKLQTRVMSSTRVEGSHRLCEMGIPLSVTIAEKIDNFQSILRATMSRVIEATSHYAPASPTVLSHKENRSGEWRRSGSLASLPVLTRSSNNNAEDVLPAGRGDDLESVSRPRCLNCR